MDISLDAVRQIADPAMRMELLFAGLARLGKSADRALRQLASEEPLLFLGVAYRWLGNQGGQNTTTARLLAAIAVEQGVLLDALSLPGELTPVEASLLIRCLAHHCPGTERMMIESFASQVDARVAPPGLFRVLDELRHLDISGASRTTLVCLLRSPNARVRSKAAEALVRTTQSADTAISLLSDPDDRVRANALEGLWPYASSPSVRRLFEQHASDSVPRIAVNALIGLYLAGQATACTRLIALSQSADPLMQRAAIWAMGHLLDPAFEEPLRDLIRTGRASIRGHTLRALVRLNKAKSRLPGSAGAEVGAPTSLAGILAAGAAVWNRWRSASPETQPNLENECFAGLDLSGADLSYCRLWGSDFRGARLDLADLFGADLRDCDFSAAHMNRTDLRAIETSPATRFEDVTLRGAAVYATPLQSHATMKGTSGLSAGITP